MPELRKKPTLTDFQRYVAELEQERGFSEQGVLKKCLLLGEEIGELFKSIRKREGISIDLGSKASTVDEELADVLIMLCSIANRLGVDLEEAFRCKEEINKGRTWTKERAANEGL
jgi:NTP pyrophosphatase (non-canonical NTP hydrolase)